MSKIVGLLLLFTTSLAVAQDTPKFEVFGGYSYASASKTLTLGRSRPNLNGWNASVAGNFNRWIGIVGDFSGYYGSPQVSLPMITPCVTPPCLLPVDFINVGLNTKEHTFLFGPQFTWRRGRISPFAHTLFGVGHASLKLDTPFSLATSSNAFAMALGGGVDFNLTHRLALRVQPDYLQTEFFSNTQKNFRISTGLVFKFGNK